MLLQRHSYALHSDALWPQAPRARQISSRKNRHVASRSCCAASKISMAASRPPDATYPGSTATTGRRLGPRSSISSITITAACERNLAVGQEVLPLEIFVEDLPQATNFVTDEGHDYPSVHHPARSAYGLKGCERAQSKLPELLAALPVESIERRADLLTAYHIQGTCRMGADPASSIVDSNLAHHQIRNLLVLGTAVWPSCGTGNPSLTAAALSLRAAHNLTRSS